MKRKNLSANFKSKISRNKFCAIFINRDSILCCMKFYKLQVVWARFSVVSFLFLGQIEIQIPGAKTAQLTTQNSPMSIERYHSLFDQNPYYPMEKAIRRHRKSTIQQRACVRENNMVSRQSFSIKCYEVRVPWIYSYPYHSYSPRPLRVWMVPFNGSSRLVARFPSLQDCFLPSVLLVL